jgi:O-antigen ligase
MLNLTVNQVKMSISSLGRSFLQNKVNFIVTLAAVVTTIFSWYNINSLAIIGMVLCRVIDGGPKKAIRAAFSNKYFLAYLALFLMGTAGLLYTHDLANQQRTMEKEMTLLAVAFTLCGGPFAEVRDYKRFMTAYCATLFAACTYCLVKATMLYMSMPVKDDSVFFYHALTTRIGENAVFFSVYMIFGLLFLLVHPLQLGPIHDRVRRTIQIFLIFLFAGVVILLSSKLLLIVLFLILLNQVVQRFVVRRNYFATIAAVVIGLLALVLVFSTDNYIKRRYLDLERGDMSLVKQKKFLPFTEFNGATLRLLQWKFANQIMREHDSWVFGVSPGDAQDLLNEKYRKANIFMGDPSKRLRGFTDYNFHNQYIETTVRSGFLGLVILAIVCCLMVYNCEKWRTAEMAFMTLTLLSICAVESFLTLQHGVFAFVFMPLMLLYSPKKKTSRDK